jgi:hypothetical protein
MAMIPNHPRLAAFIERMRQRRARARGLAQLPPALRPVRASRRAQHASVGAMPAGHLCAWVVPRYDRELAAMVAHGRRLTVDRNDPQVLRLVALAAHPDFWSPEPIGLAVRALGCGNHRTAAALHCGAVFRDVLLLEHDCPEWPCLHMVALIALADAGAVRGHREPSDLTPQVLARLAEWRATGLSHDQRRDLVKRFSDPLGGLPTPAQAEIAP